MHRLVFAGLVIFLIMSVIFSGCSNKEPRPFPQTTTQITTTTTSVPTIPQKTDQPPEPTSALITITPNTLKTTNYYWYPTNVGRIQQSDGWDEINIAVTVLLDTSVLKSYLDLSEYQFRIGWGKSGGESSLTWSGESYNTKVYGGMDHSGILIGGAFYNFSLGGKIPSTATDLRLILKDKNKTQSCELQNLNSPIPGDLYDGKTYQGLILSDVVVNTTGSSLVLTCRIKNPSENNNLDLKPLKIYLYDNKNFLVYVTSNFLGSGWNVGGGITQIAPLLSKEVSAYFDAEKSDEANLGSATQWIMTYNDEYVAKGSPNSQNPNITNVLPDLVVTDISFPLRTYSVGEDLQITFRVANQGQTPAKRFVVSVYVDKDIIKDIPWDKGLEDGGNLRETVSWKATTGNHIFKVVVDNYKEVSESNETNNEKSIDYSGAVLPDLVVTDISFPLHTYSVGEDLQITFRVGNQGQTTAQRFVVSVYVDKDIIKDIPWDKGLEGGGNLSETVSWEATTGNHIFKVVVDNYKEVSESNETNNEKSIDYSGTILPDLVVSNLRWELSGPYFGEVAIYAEIKNQGQGSFLVPQNAKNYITVTVKGDGQIIKLGFIYKLLPGETVTLYGVCRIMPGLNTVTADIDTQNLFTESDETNNTATITFTKDEVLGR